MITKPYTNHIVVLYLLSVQYIIQQMINLPFGDDAIFIIDTDEERGIFPLKLMGDLAPKLFESIPMCLNFSECVNNCKGVLIHMFQDVQLC